MPVESEPLASESMDFVYEHPDDPGGETRLDKNTGQLHLKASQNGNLEQIAISLGMDVAVRLDALETYIENKIKEDWKASACFKHSNLSALASALGGS
ncbi:Rmnd1 [Symbiodinium pilosum]|uniref:Rmnd1 protein n=1 Tax=Symbiodinium pilosum TaxID=2952 RepID=A0A812WXV5_SYMPI|nr:Rmnd1 [Symbiodinium pilosum]